MNILRRENVICVLVKHRLRLASRVENVENIRAEGN